MAFDLTGIGMTSQRTRDRLVKRLESQGIHDSRVLELIRAVPRHIFIDEALAHRAYEDTALPIGHNQTISQPFVVALMTQSLFSDAVTADRAANRVERPRLLEVGTGSGYQTAILAGLAERVFSVERIAPLLSRAEARLKALGVRNARTRLADGQTGWPAEGPFDGIMVTAAARSVPDELTEQLADGGRLVIPVGGDIQQLKVLDRVGDSLRTTTLRQVRFVPITAGVVR